MNLDIAEGIMSKIRDDYNLWEIREHKYPVCVVCEAVYFESIFFVVLQKNRIGCYSQRSPRCDSGWFSLSDPKSISKTKTELDKMIASRKEKWWSDRRKESGL